MRIELGKYVLYSDQWSMWINEKFETRNKKTKELTGRVDERRVAGYSTSLTNLLRSFMEAKVGGSDAESLEKLIEVLIATFEDMVELNREAFDNDIAKLKEMANGQ